LPQIAAAVNAIMALQENRVARRPRAESMPRTTISVSARIDAPITRVFDRFTDLDRVTDAVSGIVGIERLTGEGFGMGARWRETRRLLGRYDSAEMEVTAFDRNHGYTIAHRKAGLRIETAFTFEPVGTGTLVAIEFTLEAVHVPAALLTPINWVIAGKVRHVLHADLTDLKADLERPFQRCAS
jgi:hypothetical protein